jgi:hypothetical protein
LVLVAAKKMAGASGEIDNDLRELNKAYAFLY